MRVTQSMLKDTMLRGVTRNMLRLEALEEQITTGQRINRPSDDPVTAAAILRLDSSKAETDQHIKNIDDARSWLDLADQSLDSIGQQIQRAREISLAALNGTASAQVATAPTFTSPEPMSRPTVVFLRPKSAMGGGAGHTRDDRIL